MRLRGAREVVAGLRSTGAAMMSLDATTQRYGRHLDETTKRSFLMNQALFTLRRYSYMATLALSAGAITLLHWGYQYNAQIQSAKVALGAMLPSQTAVNDEISHLYRIAAYTPFLFTDISTAARRFLSFGMTLQQTNDTILSVTDSLSQYGIVTGAALNRASLALGHMMSLGRLTGQIVYQLARDNIPIIQALEKELGLTGDQLRHVGTLGISASDAINALNAYVKQSPIHGAGLRFGLGTVSGLLSTIRDYTAQAMGMVEAHQFATLQRVARRTVDFFMAHPIDRQHGGLMGFFGAVSPAIPRVINLIGYNLHTIGMVLRRDVIPAFRTASHLLGPVLYLWLDLLSHVARALALVGHHTWLLKGVVMFLALALTLQAARWAALMMIRAAMIPIDIIKLSLERAMVATGLASMEAVEGQTLAERRYIFVLTATGEALRVKFIWLARSTAELIYQNVILRIWAGMQIAAAAASRFFTVSNVQQSESLFIAQAGFLSAGAAVLSYIGELISAAIIQSAIAIEMAADWLLAFWPIGLAIVAVGLLVFGFYELYRHWTTVWHGIRAGGLWVFNFFRHNWKMILLFAVAPFAGAALLIFHHFDQIKKWAVSLLHFVTRVFTRLWHHVTSIFHRITGSRFVHPLLHPGGLIGLQHGGTVTGGGAFLVGERGPEIAMLPRGAAVSPIGAGGIPSLSGVFEITLINKTILDGKQIAQNVSKIRQDVTARR